MQRVTSAEQFASIIGQNEPVIAVFTASWCPDCRFIEPFMPAVEEKFAQLTFVELDRDELPDVFAEYQVMGIPSFISFKSGRELTRFVSKLRKSREEIEAYLRRTEQVAELM